MYFIWTFAFFPITVIEHFKCFCHDLHRDTKAKDPNAALYWRVIQKPEFIGIRSCTGQSVQTNTNTNQQPWQRNQNPRAKKSSVTLTRLTPVSHMLRLQCVCSPCALHMRCRSSTDSLCFHTGRVCSPLLIRDCLPQTQHLSIILISNPNVVSLYWNCFFRIVVILFYHSTITQSFIDIFTFKLN